MLLNRLSKPKAQSISRLLVKSTKEIIIPQHRLLYNEFRRFLTDKCQQIHKTQGLRPAFPNKKLASWTRFQPSNDSQERV